MPYKNINRIYLNRTKKNPYFIFVSCSQTCAPHTTTLYLTNKITNKLSACRISRCMLRGSRTSTSILISIIYGSIVLPSTSWESMKSYLYSYSVHDFVPIHTFTYSCAAFLCSHIIKMFVQLMKKKIHWTNCSRPPFIFLFTVHPSICDFQEKGRKLSLLSSIIVGGIL